MATKIESFGELLKQYIKNEEPVAVEKMSGSTPKAALMFYKTFMKGRYELFNLTDLSDRYYERATDLFGFAGVTMRGFADYTIYNHDINVASLKLKDYADKVDAVVYWSGALNCFQPFNEEQEEKYRTMLAEEKEKGEEKCLTTKEIEVNMQKRFESMGMGVVTDELAKLIEDDISVLGDDGIIMSNYEREKESIRDIIKTKGFSPTDFLIESVPRGFHDYEKCITIWTR